LEGVELEGVAGMSNSNITLALYSPTQAHPLLSDLWQWVKAQTMAGNRVQISAKTETRSLAQNRRLWAMLGEISQQVVWHGRKLSAEDWKHVLSASLKKQDAVPGIDGGFVVLGLSTSKMTVAEMSELQTLMEAFGAQQGVKFSAQIDPEPARF
jgi:hypothetical protein